MCLMLTNLYYLLLNLIVWRGLGHGNCTTCVKPCARLRGYITEYEKIEDGKQGVIKVTLKYVNKERVIKGIKRISKPGLRVYAKSTELPQVLNGLGVAIISTSNGVMTDREARKNKLGGEVIAFVW